MQLAGKENLPSIQCRKESGGNLGKMKEFFSNGRRVMRDAFNDSKFVAFVAFVLFVIGSDLILINKTRNATSVLLVVGAVILFAACYAAFERYNGLREHEKRLAFWEEIERFLLPSDVIRGVFESRIDFQALVDRVLRQKARVFYDARMRQQEHCDDAALSLELQREVNVAKQAFWRASDAARGQGFKVRKSHVEWLREPAAEKK